MAEKEHIYHACRFLDSLQEGKSAATKEKLAEVTDRLGKLFSVNVKSVDDFLAHDLGSDLPVILNAGVQANKAGLYDDDLAEAQSDPHYAPYTQVIIGRQYLSGTVEGTLENLRRKSRMLAKFKEHCPRTDLTIDNPAHPLRTAFIKTSGRWPWANQKDLPPPAAPTPPPAPQVERVEPPPPPPPAAAKAEKKEKKAAPPPPSASPVKKEIPAVITQDYAAGAMADTHFFKKMGSIDRSRDYIIIVDKSASMKLGGRWKQAEEAVKKLAISCCECDEDGITLYFFSSHSKTSKGEFPAFNKYDNIKTQKEVMKLFGEKENAPKGGTDLTKVLTDAFQPTGKPMTILLITDGVPDDIKSAENLIISTCNGLAHHEDLLMTVVQVGDDKRADEYLNELDTKLVGQGAKYDIVDVIPNKQLASLDFGQIVDFAIKSQSG